MLLMTSAMARTWCPIVDDISSGSNNVISLVNGTDATSPGSKVMSYIDCVDDIGNTMRSHVDGADINYSRNAVHETAPC